MGLEIKSILVYKEERKVKVKLSLNQWAVFQPFGLDFITNTSELVLKKNIRFIGEKLNKLDYFQRHKESVKPNLSEIRGAENELKMFIGNKVESIN